MRAFDIFRDTELIIESAENTGAYSSAPEFRELFRVMADVQPVSVSGARAAYGIADDAEFAAYCGECGARAGMRAAAGGERFVITGVEKRHMGMKLYLKKDVR